MAIDHDYRVQYDQVPKVSKYLFVKTYTFDNIILVLSCDHPIIHYLDIL